MVIDLRPQEEKDGVGLTELSGKCNKDVYRIADVASDPLKVEVLKADLAQQMGLASDGKTLMVLNWSIYYNKQTRTARSQAQRHRHPGLWDPRQEKRKGAGSKCSREESAGGWFADGDVTTDASRRSSRNSRAPSAASRTTFASFIRRAGRSRANSMGCRRTTRDELLETVHKTAEALATAIVQ